MRGRSAEYKDAHVMCPRRRSAQSPPDVIFIVSQSCDVGTSAPCFKMGIGFCLVYRFVPTSQISSQLTMSHNHESCLIILLLLLRPHYRCLFPYIRLCVHFQFVFDAVLSSAVHDNFSCEHIILTSLYI